MRSSARALQNNQNITTLDISSNRIGLLVHPEWLDTAQPWPALPDGLRYHHIDGQLRATKG
jgi:hypothetical protein